ncbi:MAG: hypothetical protein EPN34_07030 [Burkholderiaceae bacterium]|nr:MAG: hypothetical protein EPN34_07030 [Burkholderiaceae bacterium]
MSGLDRAHAALQTIPADLPREDWVRVGMAAQAAGLEFKDFDDWSAAAGSYDARAARDTWRSFRPDKGIGPGTLYRLAVEHGWKADAPQAPAYPRSTRTEPREPKPRPGMAPADVWARCTPATNTHGYIEKKRAAGVPLDGLRAVPAGDVLRIAGQAVAGFLAVPAYSGGALQSIQFIPPEGKKLNLPRASMAGASFTVGEPEAGAPLYLVEGIGQAWAVWQATGRAAVVCFGWGNVGTIARQLRQKDGAGRLVLVPDAGKEAQAERIAQELGIATVSMPKGSPANFDAWDLKERDGPDALAALLGQAQGPRPLLVPVSVADVLTHPSPPPRFVWDGYAPRGVVTSLGAHGGVGKSTVALMLAVAVATGRPLFGVATERCNVLFASFEDSGDVVRHRLGFICRQWEIDPAALCALSIVDGTANPELFTAERRDAGDVTASYIELRKLARGAGLVVVDNASDAYGADEIQRRQVRAFIRTLTDIAKENAAAVLLLAHVDKNTSKQRKAEGGEGYSGSTAWNNSVRSRLFMTRDESGTLTLEHQKSNFGPMREPLALEWPQNELPQVLESLSPVVQGISDKNDTRALLKLIHEFSERGEWVSSGTTGTANAAHLLGKEPSYPRRKPAETFTLLRNAERSGYVQRTEHRTKQRRFREVWQLTPEGENFAGIPSAPIAPIARQLVTSATGAEGARGAPLYCAGGMGERARASSGAGSGAQGVAAHPGAALVTGALLEAVP